MSGTATTIENRFYVTGGTLHRDARCYVERHADHELFEALRGAEFCYVLTARQMGKSSLMVRTAARLRETGTGAALLDLTAIGQNVSPEQWYCGLLSQMGEQLELEDELMAFWQVHYEVGPLQRWLHAVEQVLLPRYPGLVVIFIDEIDAVRSLPFSTDEFFAAIRELYNRRAENPELERLTFCLLGVASPSDLIGDTRMTPFNVGHRIELHDFTAWEAASLAQGFAQDEDSREALLKRILHWTGGHPYLTQRLCSAVVEASGGKGDREVDRLCRELFFERRAAERDDNLLFVRERMLRSEVDSAGLLTLYARVRSGSKVLDDETNPLVTVLRLSGLVRVNQGKLTVRNRIYARVFDDRWVLANMPDAELRRQRAAYRKGLLRSSAIAAVIVLAIAILGRVALQQRNRAREQQEANRRLLYTAQMNLAVSDWKAENLGRMLESLKTHIPAPGQQDLRGFEWYYLWRLSHTDLVTMHHSDAVTALAASPDGERLASGGNDGTVKIWHAATGQELLTMRSHTLAVVALVFSPDGRRVASGSTDGTIKLSDPATGNEMLIIRPGPVNSLAFSPDGRNLAAGIGDTTVQFLEFSSVRIWDTTTGRELCAITGRGPVAYSPDGVRLAGRGLNGLQIWDSFSGRELISIPAGMYTTCLAYSPDGNRIASGTFKKMVLWDVATRKPAFSVQACKGDVTSVAFSPDRKWMAAAADTTVRIWDAATGAEGFALKGHTAQVSCLDFLPGREKIAAASIDGTIKVWDLSAIKEEPVLRGHQYAVRTVHFSPDGKLLVSAGSGHACVWDLTTDRLIRKIGTDVGKTALSPDVRKLASASTDNIVSLWDFRTGELMLKYEGHRTFVRAFAFSPDGKTVASGGFDKDVHVWEVATGRRALILKGHNTAITSVTYSPDGNTIVSADLDTIRFWDSTTGRELRVLRPEVGELTAIVVSPDGKTLACGGFSAMVRLLDFQNGRPLSTFKGHSNVVLSLQFSPDGRRLATASMDRTVKLWDLATGQQVADLEGHTGGVRSVAWSPDGRILASAGDDSTIRLWRAATEAEVLARIQRGPVAGSDRR